MKNLSKSKKSYLSQFSSSFLPLIFSLILLTVSLSPNRAMANPIQENILNAGINLGWAAATLDLYGDQNPNNARTIAESLNRAVQHIQRAAQLFEEPYQTNRRLSGTDQRIIDKINLYPQRAPRLSISHRAGYVKNIWGMYRQGFQTTFTDPSAGYHYFPNCDRFILDTGYHFGRAQIAASATGNRARSYQSGANGSMRSAIHSGLSVGVDGYEYGPRTNAIKACCCFGYENFWRSLPTYQSNSPLALYTNNLAVLQGIVRNAGVPCNCGGTELSRRSIIGRWKWFTGRPVDFFKNNRWKTVDGRDTGKWEFLPNGSILVTPDKGTWQDTVTVAADGNSLSGKGRNGVAVSATKIGKEVNGNGGNIDCSHCSTYENWLKKNVRACGYHGNRLHSICQGDPECVRWNKDCNRVKKQLRECLHQCQGR